MIFSDAGKQHTEKTLEAAKEAALARGIKYVVVATTTGETGVAAAKLFAGTGVKVIAVTHCSGFREKGVSEMDAARREEIEKLGGAVHTGTMIMHALSGALYKKFQGFSNEQVAAATLRLFGQGTKVCVEIAAMACDSGLLPASGDVICVAGTGRGADTCIIASPDSSIRFFDIKVREIIAKPADW